MADRWTDEYDRAWVRIARQTWVGARVTHGRNAVMLSYADTVVWADVPRDEDLAAVIRRARWQISMKRADDIIGVRPASKRPEIPQ